MHAKMWAVPGRKMKERCYVQYCQYTAEEQAGQILLFSGSHKQVNS